MAALILHKRDTYTWCKFKNSFIVIIDLQNICVNLSIMLAETVENMFYGNGVTVPSWFLAQLYRTYVMAGNLKIDSSNRGYARKSFLNFWVRFEVLKFSCSCSELIFQQLLLHLGW